MSGDNTLSFSLAQPNIDNDILDEQNEQILQKQGYLDIIRVASVFIFLCDFATKILYLRISKFASIQMRELYIMFIELRLLLILIYTVSVVASNTMKM